MPVKFAYFVKKSLPCGFPIAIWLEKDKNGVSEIYSLSDYIIEDEDGNAKKVRNDATYNKDYLTGRYGAIPVLEEFDVV